MLPDLDARKLVLPAELREKVLEESHSDPQSGHLSINKTYHRVSREYYCPGAFNDVVKFVRQCDNCQRCKVAQVRPESLTEQRVVEKPWTVVSGDVMGPFPRSRAGYIYVLVFQDLFTEWAEIILIRSANVPTIRKNFEEFVVSRWGTPEIIHTDNGTEFDNKLVGQTCNFLGIIHTTSSAYPAQVNHTKRVNRVLKTMIVTFLHENQTDWK